MGETNAFVHHSCGSLGKLVSTGFAMSRAELVPSLSVLLRIRSAFNGIHRQRFDSGIVAPNAILRFDVLSSVSSETRDFSKSARDLARKGLSAARVSRGRDTCRVQRADGRRGV